MATLVQSIQSFDVKLDKPLKNSYHYRNKKGKTKSLRCFPHCSVTGHTNKGQCQDYLKGGSYLTLVTPVDVKFIWNCRIFVELKPTHLDDDEQTKLCLREMRIVTITCPEECSGTQKFFLAWTEQHQPRKFCTDLWTYECTCSRWQSKQYTLHFSLVSPCGKVLATTNSNCFAIYSSRSTIRWKTTELFFNDVEINKEYVNKVTMKTKHEECDNGVDAKKKLREPGDICLSPTTIISRHNETHNVNLECGDFIPFGCITSSTIHDKNDDRLSHVVAISSNTTSSVMNIFDETMSTGSELKEYTDILFSVTNAQQHHA
jgi:hypothetical protein